MSDGMKRRDFLKVLGAGSASAAAVGCSSAGEVNRLIPYVVPDENIVPGVPTWYTTTCRECPAGCGMHVETHSGRATKVEGNPDHPISHGNLCARGQASVQGLYHPDRFRGPQIRNEQELNPTWSTAERLVTERIRAAQQAGQEIVLLTQRYTGSMDALVDEWAAAVGARRVVYDLWRDQPRAVDFSQADVLVSFGADFLETWGSPVDYARQFAQMHTYREGRRGKFIWVGPHRPLTGVNADQWLAPQPGTEIALARALAGQIDAAAAAQQTGLPQESVQALVDEFSAGNGMALGPGAAISGSNVADLKAVIESINASGAAATESAVPAGRDVSQLVEQMQAGQIGVLLIDAPNPVHTLPGALGFAAAMDQVGTCVSFSSFPDDTTVRCEFVLPDHHFLEAWGDYIPSPGITELVQPAMRPVFNTKQVGDVLLSLARQLEVQGVGGGATTYYDYLRSRWAGISGTGEAWRQALKQGGVFETAAAAGGARAQTAASGSLEPIQFDGDGDLHLVVYPSYRFYDGRLANRPWLLELPDPVIKVPWGSCVEMHPETAASMGIEQGDVVEVSSPYGSLQTFAYVYPGVRRDTVAIQAGLGHEAFGRFTEGMGVNPNVLLGASVDAATGQFNGYGVRVRIERVSGHDHRGGYNPPDSLFEQGTRIQYDREMAQAISVAEVTRLAAEGEAVIPGEDEPMTTLRGYGGFAPRTRDTDPESYPPPLTEFGEYFERQTRWGMVIDLDRCIGCSACVTACYAENNIPVVGPTEVKRGRELSWLRIERYWGVTQDPNEALVETALDDTRFLPMLCQQCGNAPCEPVCPVYASYHTPDGLNGQVYNRCVGTRYCANNCPYKVRYFNWFTYKFDEPLNWQLNPDVAVREKGVMEKCTFCIQRIHEQERNAAVEERPLRDGDIVPACAQTCPTEVFVFGNMADPESRVSQAARSVRGYRGLEELNTQPAIVYLKKVTLAEPAHGGHEVEATTTAQ